MGNQPPKINGFELNGQFYESNSSIDLVVGQPVSLTALASDINGDPLSFEWQGIGCSTETCTLDNLQEGAYPIELTVYDNNDSEPLNSTAKLDLAFAVDQAPEATLSLSSSSVSELSGTNAQAISAWLQAKDDLTIQTQLIVTWSLTLANADYSNVLQRDDDFNVRIEAGALPVGEYQLTAQVTDRNIYNEPGQSTSVSQNLVVTDDLPPTLLLNGSAWQFVATADGAEQPLTVTATITDDLTPVEQLTLDWSISPEVPFTISADNLAITIAANDLLVGDYKITANLADVQQQVSSEYDFSVDQDNPPVISSMTVTPKSQIESATQRNSLPITVLLSAKDDVSETLKVQWQITPSVDFEATDSELTIAADTVATGQYQVQAKVSDQRGQVNTKTTLFEITKRNGNVEIIID